MIQFYFLSIVFLLFSSIMFLQNRYRFQLSFSLRFTEALEKNDKYLYLFSLSGVFIFLSLVFFPIDPGPVIIGDLVPALIVLYNTLYFFITNMRKKKENGSDYLIIKKEGRRVFLGYLSLTVASLHFLFPSFVLL